MRRSVLALLLLTAVVAHSNNGDWYQHFAAGEWYFAHDQIQRAETELKAALKIANRFPPGDRRLERTLEDLGRLYEHQARLDQAQSMYGLLVAAIEVRAGNDSPQLLDPLAALGRVALSAGDPATAEASFVRYAKVAANTRAADPDQHRLVLAALARMAVLGGREQEALSYQRQAVALLDSGTADAAEREATLETLAKLELRHGSAEAGQHLLVQASRLAAKSDGGEATAMILARGAALALDAGHSEVADQLARQALDSRPSAKAELAARTALADAAWLRVPHADARLADLMGAARGSAAVAAARQRLGALAELEEKQLPAGDPALARTRKRLVHCAALAGDTDAVLRSLTQLIGEYRESGNTVAEVGALEDRASILAASGHSAEAVDANRELLQHLESVHGATDPSLLPVLQRQYDLLRSLHRNREARAVKKRLRHLERALKHR